MPARDDSDVATKPRFGRSFVEELLFAIAAGNIAESTDSKALDRATSRAGEAFRALIGTDAGNGRPKDDDDQALLQVAYWYLSHVGSDDINAVLSAGVQDEAVKHAARSASQITHRASKRARAITLERKFRKEFERIL